MPRSLYGPEAWPAQARWLDPAIVPALQINIVLRSYRDVDIGEHPPGSNRSASIDHYLRRARVPESIIDVGRGYWCGAAVGAWWEDAGAEIPLNYADCDAWMTFARETGTWIPADAIPKGSPNALAGYATIYGIPGDATHIGSIIRYDDYKRDIEGNTSSNGYSANGVLAGSKDIQAIRLLGLVRPFARVV